MLFNVYQEDRFDVNADALIMQIEAPSKSAAENYFKAQMFDWLLYDYSITDAAKTDDGYDDIHDDVPQVLIDIDFYLRPDGTLDLRWLVKKISYHEEAGKFIRDENIEGNWDR